MAAAVGGSALPSVAEGDDVQLFSLANRCVSGDGAVRCAAWPCLAVVRGMARSLGSELGGAVTPFLGDSLRGVVSRVIDSTGVRSLRNGVAVSRDGSTLLVSDSDGTIHEFARRVVGGAEHRSIAAPEPPQASPQTTMWHVLETDTTSDRVQVPPSGGVLVSTLES